MSISNNLITIQQNVYKVVSRDFKIHNNKIFICSHFYLINRWIAQVSSYDLKGNLIKTFGNNGIVVISGLNNSTENFRLELIENDLYLIGTSQKLSRDGFICKINNNTGNTIKNFGVNGIVMFDILGKNDFVADFIIENDNIIVIGYTTFNSDFAIFVFRVNIVTGKFNTIKGQNTIFNEINIEYINGVMLLYKKNTDLIPKSIIKSKDIYIISGGILNTTWDGILISITNNFVIDFISQQDNFGTYDMNNNIIKKSTDRLLLLSTATNLKNNNIVILSQYNNSLQIDNSFKQLILYTLNFDLSGKKILFDSNKMYILCNSNRRVYIVCVLDDSSFTTFEFRSKKSIVGNNIEILDELLYVSIDLHLNSIIQTIDKNIINTIIEI